MRPARYFSIIQLSNSRAFLIFIIFTQLLTGVALLRMHARQQGRESRNYIEYILDCCFNDQLLHSFFPKMKPVVPMK